MERRGSILVNRNMWEWWGWSDSFHVKAWMDLLLMAAWSEHTRDFQGEPVRLKAGQIITSQRILARRWSVGIKRVRTFLRKVEKSGAIRAHQGAHQSTIITIRNYREYQSFENTKGRKQGRKAGTRRAQGGRIPAPQKEQSNSKNTKKPKAKGVFPTALDTPAFVAKWAEWLEYRRTERKPAVTAVGAPRSLKMLAKAGPVAAIAAIDDAMANGYQGLHPKRPGTKAPADINGPIYYEGAGYQCRYCSYAAGREDVEEHMETCSRKPEEPTR